MPTVENPWAELVGPEMTNAWRKSYEEDQAAKMIMLEEFVKTAALFCDPRPITRLERIRWALQNAWRAVRLWLIGILAGDDIDYH